MPLTQDQGDQEHEARMEMMIMSIEQARVNIEKMRNDMRYESRKFTVQLLAGASAAFAAGVGALGLVLHLMGRI